MRYCKAMPIKYKNGSPAMRLLERMDQLMRLQKRVIDGMMRDTESEHQEVRDVVISRDTDPKKFVRETMARLEKGQARFADIELMFQTFFCRHYDNFEIFLEELIGDVARRDPILVQGIKIPKAFDALPPDEKLEKRLDKIARLPLGALNATIAEEIGFRLFDDDKVRDQMTYLSDVRNLLTHRYGIADSHFLDRHPTPGLSVGAKLGITMEFIRDALAQMTSTAASIQARAEQHFKFRYQTEVVGQTEWWEEPDTPLPPLPHPSNR